MFEHISWYFPDVDECEANNGTGDCSHGCENFPGGYNCTCTPGYVLYDKAGTNGFLLPEGETGAIAGDVYYINHTCVSKYSKHTLLVSTCLN